MEEFAEYLQRIFGVKISPTFPCTRISRRSHLLSFKNDNITNEISYFRRMNYIYFR